MSAEAQAARLLRWYPQTWRDRYGEEFAELLVSDLDERPLAAGRTLDVARGGTRLAVAACAVMLMLLGGCSGWVATGGRQGPDEPGLFHAGLIDVVGVAVLALALAVAVQAARAARRGLRFRPTGAVE